ncbi:MAG: hypothetical protein GYA57_02895 [Myxococcales bacterium]|nr:hypothetical protein [Myxococcales bacterium]
MTSVAATPDPFSPGVGDGRADSIVVSIAGAAALPGNRKKVEYAVASYVVVAQGGIAVRTLVTLVPIAFPPGSRPGTTIDIAVGEEWDGRDEHGGFVLDGTYDVRVVHALLGRKTSGATEPWPAGDDLVLGLVATLSGGGPGGGGEGSPWAGYGHDGVKLFGIDDAGTTVRVDDAPPEVFIDRPTDGSTVMISPVSVAGRIVDASGVRDVWVNGLPATLFGPQFEVSLDLEPGPNVIDVLAEDGAGNRAIATLTVTFAPDTTGPTIVIDYPLPGDVLLATPLNLVGRAADDSGVTGVFVNGSAAQLAGGEFHAAVDLEPGPNRVEVLAEDGWGNRSSIVVVVELAESGPPVTDEDGWVRGEVFDDATGEPMAGAVVSCASIGRWTATGDDGTFALPVPPAPSQPRPLATHLVMGGYFDTPGTRSITVSISKFGYLAGYRTIDIGRLPAAVERVVSPVWLTKRDLVRSVVRAAEGGTARSGDGTVQVVFPPGALAEDTAVTVTPIPRGRTLPSPLPGSTRFTYAVDLQPNGLALQPGMSATLRVRNSLGLPPGALVPVGRFETSGFPAPQWRDVSATRGQAVVDPTGQWVEWNGLTGFSTYDINLPSLSGALAPVAGLGGAPGGGGGGSGGCAGDCGLPPCHQQETGASSVSRSDGALREVVEIGPTGAGNPDGLSPWPLRLVYSSRAVAPTALIEAYAHGGSMAPVPVLGRNVPSIATPYVLEVHGRRIAVDYDPALPDFEPGRARFRYLFDGRSRTGEMLPTGLYPFGLSI